MAGYSIMGAIFSTPATMSDVLDKSDFPPGASYKLSDLGKITPGVTATGGSYKLSDFGGERRRFGDLLPYGYDGDNDYKGFEMTGVEEIIQGTDIADDDLNINLMSLRAVVTFDEDDYGVIFETGGSGVGCALYINNKTLYWQAGAGGTVGGSIELEANITGYSNGPREIVVTTDFQGSSTVKGTLHINGTLIQSKDEAPAYTGDVAGSGAGGSGKKYGSIAVLRNGESRNFTGTIHSVRIYNF